MTKRLITLILMLTVILLGGCMEEVSSKLGGERLKFNSEERLVIQELSNENKGEFQQFKEITDKEKVDIFFKVLSNANWEDDSGKSSYPDLMINNKYSIWILSPDNNIRVRVNNLDKNTFLSEKDSKTIYKLIADED
jgi:type III secretory pathway component EscR